MDIAKLILFYAYIIVFHFAYCICFYNTTNNITTTAANNKNNNNNLVFT